MTPGSYPNPRLLGLPAMTVMMMPRAMAVVISVVVVDAHAGADMQAANMNARADFRGSRRRAEQAQGENGDDQFLHGDSLFWI
jgi:hypothetical protein